MHLQLEALLDPKYQFQYGLIESLEHHWHHRLFFFVNNLSKSVPVHCLPVHLPIAKVMESLTSFLTALTISAFCDGLTLQQMTDRQFNDKNMKFSLSRGSTNYQSGEIILLPMYTGHVKYSVDP